MARSCAASSATSGPNTFWYAYASSYLRARGARARLGAGRRSAPAPPAPAAPVPSMQCKARAAPRRARRRRRGGAPGQAARGGRAAPQGHRRGRVLRAGRGQVGEAGGRVGAPGVLQLAGLREREVPRARHLGRARLPHEPRHERAVLDERLPERQVQAAARHSVCVCCQSDADRVPCTASRRKPPCEPCACLADQEPRAPAHGTQLQRWHERIAMLLGRARPQARAAARGPAAGRAPELAQARRRGRRVAAEQHHAVLAAHLCHAHACSVTAARGDSGLARATAGLSSSRERHGSDR